MRARLRIERDHAIEGRREIERSIDNDGRGLEAASFPIVAAIRDVAGMEYPGDCQPRHILAIDLRKWRVTHAARVMPVVGPSFIGCALRLIGRRVREQDDDAKKDRAPKGTRDVTNPDHGLLILRGDVRGQTIRDSSHRSSPQWGGGRRSYWFRSVFARARGEPFRTRTICTEMEQEREKAAFAALAATR